MDWLLIPATITVFINGVPKEVPRGPIDLRAMFGQDVMLVHSTGALLPVNDYGILTQSLQMGESYFLVSLHIIRSHIYLSHHHHHHLITRYALDFIHSSRPSDYRCMLLAYVYMHMHASIYMYYV